MKLSALAAICISLISGGILYVERKKQKAEILGKISLMFSELASLVPLFGTDIINTLKKLSTLPQLEDFSFLKNFLSGCYYGCNIKEIWLEELDASPEIFLAGRKAYGLLSAFPSSLGMNSAENFSSGCRKSADIFSEMKKEEEKLIEEKGSLAVYAGFLSAAAVFVLMI